MYARLAVREKLILSSLHGRAPGLNLDEVVCRNVILCFFSNGTEREQRRVFARYWLPIEILAPLKAANSVDSKRKGGKRMKISDVLGTMLHAFVGEEVGRRSSREGDSGGGSSDAHPTRRAACGGC